MISTLQYVFPLISKRLTFEEELRGLSRTNGSTQLDDHFVAHDAEDDGDGPKPDLDILRITILVFYTVSYVVLFVFYVYQPDVLNILLATGSVIVVVAPASIWCVFSARTQTGLMHITNWKLSIFFMLFIIAAILASTVAMGGTPLYNAIPVVVACIVAIAFHKQSKAQGTPLEEGMANGKRGS